jgi:bifunctional non-homologous end joining protein LigD
MVNSLTPYRSKRNFAITPEPAGDNEEGAGALTFVIQKHWASRLHYDFRLELDGTMKSWAVPKGPSYDSKDKRMAVHVEDHPVSYSSFEGTIPEGQYGAGKVIIWDKGTWHPLGDPHQGYADGNLKFELRGHKMHGKWVLVRIKHANEKQEPWLLIKEKDEFVRPAAQFSVADEMPASVKDLAAPRDSGLEGAAPASGNAGAAPAAGKAGTAAELPKTLAPQLATLVDAAPATPADWLFEIKFDGYRVLTRIDGKQIALFTRNSNDWTDKLKPLRNALAKMKLPAGWYDGEIVVHGENGQPDFGALQSAFEAGNTSRIAYYLFDLPYFDGRDLRAEPLETRRALLQAALAKAPSPHVQLSAAFDAAPMDMVAAARELGLEGIVGKRRGSPYVSRRSPDWIKLKCGQRQEFVIGGYTDPQGTRTGFGALLLGARDEHGVLRYAGNVGTGFDQAALDDLTQRLTKLAADASPFAPDESIAKKSHFVKPALVAEISFARWPRGGRIQHAVFHGLRLDQEPAAVKREVAARREPTKNQSQAPGAMPEGIRVSNPERVIDPGTGITKIELVRYYTLVSGLLLPHLKGRPVSLVRAPGGVGGELFFQKHADTGKLPGVRQLAQALDPGHPPMLEVATAQGLQSAAQWNVVEFHTQNACAKAYEKPNRMVFDLDPGEGVKWLAIQEAAQLMHAFLEQLGLSAFLKTSGGKGLHLVVPIRQHYDWDSVKAFSQAIVAHLAHTIPQRFVLKSGPANRVGKIFIDYLRNGRGATTVAAWSARARPGLGISVPVGWEELKSLRSGDHWTVRSVHARLDQGNDPWFAYAKSARSLTAAMKQLGFTPPPPPP